MFIVKASRRWRITWKQVWICLSIVSVYCSILHSGSKLHFRHIPMSEGCRYKKLEEKRGNRRTDKNRGGKREKSKDKSAAIRRTWWSDSTGCCWLSDAMNGLQVELECEDYWVSESKVFPHTSPCRVVCVWGMGVGGYEIAVLVSFCCLAFLLALDKSQPVLWGIQQQQQRRLHAKPANNTDIWPVRWDSRCVRSYLRICCDIHSTQVTS